MKCPKCSGKHPYKDGMRCRCGYRFILDPKSDGFADGKILAAYRRASGGETHYFTAPQMVTAVCNLPRSKAPMIIGFLLLAVGMGVFFLAITNGKLEDGAFIPAAFFTFVGLLLLVGTTLESRIDKHKFLRAVGKFESNRKPFPYLLREPGRLAVPPPEWEESDIYDYGAEGVLVVDRDLIVDLLVLNDFHTSNRVLVIGESGYPDYLMPLARRLLEERDDLPIFLLHDAQEPDSNGSMLERIQSTGRFPIGKRPVVDLGLHISDLKRTPKLRRFKTSDGVALDHLAWDRLAPGLVACLAVQQPLVEVLRGDHNAEANTSFG